MVDIKSMDKAIPELPIRLTVKPVMAIIFIVLCVIFVLLSLFLIIRERELAPQIIYFFAFASSIVGCFYFAKLLIKRPLELEINEQGIIVKKFPLIKWSDIEALEILTLTFKYYSNKVIKVIVNNPEQYIGYSRMSKTNINNYGTPVLLNGTLADVEIKQLHEWLNFYWQKNKIN